MADPADYCELCDLPLSQCIHGQPPPEPEPPRATPPRSRSTPSPRPSARPSARPSTRSSARPSAGRVPGSPAASSAPRKWTQPRELVPHIIAALDQAGGRLEAEEMFAALEARVELRPGDRETNPQGELRWRAAARKARKELIDSGVMAQAGPGVWQLA